MSYDYRAAANREIDNGTLTRAYMFGWRHLGYSWKDSISKARNLEIPPGVFG